MILALAYATLGVTFTILAVVENSARIRATHDALVHRRGPLVAFGKGVLAATITVLTWPRLVVELHRQHQTANRILAERAGPSRWP